MNNLDILKTDHDDLSYIILERILEKHSTDKIFPSYETLLSILPSQFSIDSAEFRKLSACFHSLCNNGYIMPAIGYGYGKYLVTTLGEGHIEKGRF